MGRERRFGSGPAPDLEPRLVLARDDLRVVSERAGELWEHVDATRPADPLLVKPGRTAPSDSPALWLGPGPVREVYMEVVAEVAKADDLLGRNTDVPAHVARLTSDARPLTGERAPLHGLEEFRAWCKVLDGMLSWCQSQDFRAPEASAVLEACEHVGAARRHIDEFWHRVRQRMCEQPNCNPGGRPRPLVASDGKTCRACRKRKEREAKAAEQRRREELAQRRKAS